MEMVLYAARIRNGVYRVCEFPLFIGSNSLLENMFMSLGTKPRLVQSR